MSVKPIKKLLAVLLAALLVLPVLTGCSKSSGAIELEAKNKIEEETLAEITRYANDNIGQLLSGNSYQAFVDYRAQGQILVSAPFDNSLNQRWGDFVSQHGEVVDASATESEKNEEGYVSHIVLTGEDGQMMRLNVTFSNSGHPYLTTLEPYADDSNMSFGDKMAQAGMNTLVGLLVVFAVLILLSLIISAFKFIGAAESRMNAKKDAAKAAQAPAPAAPAAPAAAPADDAAPEAVPDDAAIAAVIAAAIAANERIPEDGFIVRSIVRL